MKALQKYGSIAFTIKQPHGIRAMFKNESLQENTQCGPTSFIYSSKHICNYTLRNDGLPFFCGKPIHKQFSCSDIYAFTQGPFNYTYYVSPADKIQNPGHGVFSSLLRVSLKISDRNTNIPCNSRNPLLSWKEQVPKAFWLNGIWNFVNCYSPLQHKVTEYRSCLKSKTLIFFGDSTIGQYVTYLVTEVLNRNETKYGKYNSTSRMTSWNNTGIHIIRMSHAMPLHYNYLGGIKHIMSVPHTLDLMRTDPTVDEKSYILVIHYAAHFTAYPPSEYRKRIKHLVGAIVRLLEAKPSIKVLFKSPHVFINDAKWFDPHITLLFKEIVEK